MPDQLQALIVDYGGVLTSSLQDCMGAFCEADGVDPEELERVIKSFLDDGADNPVHALETGSIPVAEFEVLFAERLRTRDGAALSAPGLLGRLFGGFGRDEVMHDALLRARAHGLRTALLSNSWGTEGYPRERWDEMFDAVVISGEVGLRKPQPEIYRYTADQLGVVPQACVFVDDLAHNVRGATAVGMAGIHHSDAPTTIRELEALFGRTLA